MTFQEIGAQFIGHYFESLKSNRQNMAPLYTNDSMLSYEGEQFLGNEQIMGKVGGLPGLVFDSANATIDYQPSVNDGIFCFISGNLMIEGSDQALRFTQTFLLQKGGTNGYYIHNEVFRLNLG